MLYGIQSTSCTVDTHGVICIFKAHHFWFNRFRYARTFLDSTRETVCGESIGKAVKDLISSGLEYLEYVYNTTNWFRTRLSYHVTISEVHYIHTQSNTCT